MQTAIGPENDDYPDSDIEIRLAEYLASAANRDPEDVRIIDDVMQLVVDDDAVELLQEGCIEVALDTIFERTYRPRPRSPIEQLVDRACGIVR